MKKAMLTYLKELNSKGTTITRLWFNNGKEFVEDFSPFANTKYMSNELLDSLRNGRTLTKEEKEELNTFIIEASI